MTVDEKIGQMIQIEQPYIAPADVSKYFIGPAPSMMLSCLPMPFKPALVRLAVKRPPIEDPAP